MVLSSCAAWAGAKEYTVGSLLMLAHVTANQRAAFCFVILTCKPLAFLARTISSIHIYEGNENNLVRGRGGQKFYVPRLQTTRHGSAVLGSHHISRLTVRMIIVITISSSRNMNQPSPCYPGEAQLSPETPPGIGSSGWVLI